MQKHKYFNMETPSKEKVTTISASQQIFTICGSVYTTPMISHMQLISCSDIQEVYITVQT
jgi:hypothetical protein